LRYFFGERIFSMKLLITAAFASVLSFGVLGAASAMADGLTSGRAGVDVVGPQITRELATQTSKQVSTGASQAVQETQTR
jgi:hypothetical protein